MTRNSALKIVNPIFGLLLVNQALTGFFADKLSHEMFGLLHAKGAIALLSMAALHLLLNWNWIRANFLPKPPAAKV